MVSSLRARVVLLALLAAGGALLVTGCGSEKPATPPASPTLRLPDAPDASGAATGATCMPTGAHPKHAQYACTACHLTSGIPCFDPAGPATIAGAPAPAFDPATKTCSNVACHGVPAGVFVYYFPGGDGEPEARSAPFGGTSQPTPSWYASGAGCRACHDLSYAGSRYPWHGGAHGGGNGCALCHLDATGTATASGPSADSAINTALTCPPNTAAGGTRSCASYHANGALNVTPKFKTSCFGCH
jgi:hypothetical protein